MDADPLSNLDAFAQLGLDTTLTSTLHALGYERPTPIQQQAIPLMLDGHDLIGQAQTGTGKTAAFALPILQSLDLNQNTVQALVLTPTRELAIQVAEAIHVYGRQLGRVRVLPVYGGDSIQKQVGRLRGGVHVVVGTPGRIMDHLRRSTLNLSSLHIVVLDEADEMLRMGFQEDVEWILAQAPAMRQTVLFSATMPKEVRRIADRYLRDPIAVEIQHKTLTAPTVEQHYIQVPERQKLDVLTHLLESETGDGEAVLIFVRTKLGAADVAEKLQARGYAVEAMHGDMSQAQRESVIRRLREGQVEIVVATDVAARGLDVEHIGQVINYDIPNDPESYVHRIGRTARAGRAGRAISFVTPREGHMLAEIERFTGKQLTAVKAPSRATVAARRIELFKTRILKMLDDEEIELYLAMVQTLAQESGRDIAEIAAAAARLARGDKPLAFAVPAEAADLPRSENGMVRLFVDIGRNSGIRPADIVGAIANEAGIPGRQIGAIDIYDDFTLVDVPFEYAQQVLDLMSSATIRNQATRIRLTTAQDVLPPRRSHKADRGMPRRKPSGRAQAEWAARPRKRPYRGANGD